MTVDGSDDDKARALEELSALADGEADAAAEMLANARAVVPAEYLYIDAIAPEHLRGSYYGAQNLAQAGGAISPVLAGMAQLAKADRAAARLSFEAALKIKPGSHALAGSEVKLDLLRYVPLEDWVLEMERTAFPPAEVPPGEASPSAMLMTQPGTNPG